MSKLCDEKGCSLILIGGADRCRKHTRPPQLDRIEDRVEKIANTLASNSA